MSETTNTPQLQGDPGALGDAGKKALKTERDRADEAEKKLKASEARVSELETEVQTLTTQVETVTQDAEAEKQKLESDITSLTLNVSRLTVGIENKLPLNLIERMQGEDEEALRADAKKLAEFVPDSNPSPFPKADPSQGAKGTVPNESNADRFAAFMESKLS